MSARLVDRSKESIVHVSANMIDINSNSKCCVFVAIKDEIV